MLDMIQTRKLAGKYEDRSDLFSLLMDANEQEDEESPLTDSELISRSSDQLAWHVKDLNYCRQHIHFPPGWP
jgi:hypothetical protein